MECEVRNKMFSDKLPPINLNLKMQAVQISNGRNCRDCGKSSVCKYQEIVVKEVEKLIGELKNKELPLFVNINCNEFLHKGTGTIRNI